MKNATGRT